MRAHCQECIILVQISPKAKFEDVEESGNLKSTVKVWEEMKDEKWV